MQPLNEKEQAQVRSSMAGVASRASEVIQRSANGAHAVEFVVSLHASIDKVMATLTAGEPKPDCKPGCAFCCEARVEVSDPEALHIARHVLGLPAARQKALTTALATQSKLRSGASPYARVPCAFLDRGLCSIYEHRPASCRKAHSLSLKACSDNEPLVPQDLGTALQCEVLIAGTNAGYVSSSLPAGRNELSTAVLAAVSSAEKVHDWYRGKPLLQPSAASAAEDQAGDVP